MHFECKIVIRCYVHFEFRKPQEQVDGGHNEVREAVQTLNRRMCDLGARVEVHQKSITSLEEHALDATLVIKGVGKDETGFSYRRKTGCSG